MGIPTVNSCCCGCSLKTGTQVIGWVELITYIVVLITSSALASQLENYRNNTDYSPAEIEAAYISFIIISVISAIQLAMTFLMLWGVKKDNPSYFMPWKVFAGINIVVSLVNMIVSSVNLPSSGVASAVISALAGICFKIYMFIVVHSYGLQLSLGNSNAGRPAPPGFARSA